MKKKQYRNFEKAKQFVHSLKLKNTKEWIAYRNSDKKPEDIPKHPVDVYKNKGWNGIGDWLGTGRIANKDLEFLTFDNAKKFVHSLNLKNQKEWKQYCESGNKPDNIPSAPWSTYKNKDWKSLGDWLGTGTIAHRNRKFRSFKEAKKFVKSLNLKSKRDWENLSKSNNIPSDIPSIPRRTYKKEWKGWGDFLGTGTIQPQLMKYRSFSDAKKFVQSLGLKGYDDWEKYCASGNKPDDIPSNPWNTYKEWKKK